MGITMVMAIVSSRRVLVGTDALPSPAVAIQAGGVRICGRHGSRSGLAIEIDAVSAKAGNHRLPDVSGLEIRLRADTRSSAARKDGVQRTMKRSEQRWGSLV